MRRVLIACALLPVAAARGAGEEPFVQRLSGMLQAQRNQALDQAAVCQARAEGVQSDLAKAQARVRELEEKLAALSPVPSGAAESR